MLSELVSGEDSLPGCVLTWLFLCVLRKRKISDVSSPYKATTPIGLGFHRYDLI